MIFLKLIAALILEFNFLIFDFHLSLYYLFDLISEFCYANLYLLHNFDYEKFYFFEIKH